MSCTVFKIELTLLRPDIVSVMCKNPEASLKFSLNKDLVLMTKASTGLEIP